MELLYTKTSPLARKVGIFAKEKEFPMKLKNLAENRKAVPSSGENPVKVFNVRYASNFLSRMP
ncbi:hypothetical protein BES34_016965 [Leptospira inadai serovar Lyme]|uniref:Uncharacterized protein n=1 Tax=Leptospira inadai serovar Lyme TaxID=293084 RepID=A0ABX4YEZ2_9LEPT|nr:hypothetical protein BES34_016965 [Leptospira inadai serovar Lyme]